MKEYPSISAVIQMGLPIYAFDKIDGSNIRAEWSRKRGFYKFGSRSRLLGTDQESLVKAEPLIRTQGEQVEALCKKNRWDRIVLFYEFAGPNSSFGNHVKDDEHRVWLIDACPHKRDIIPPREFSELFSELNPSPLLYRGNCNNGFVQSVRDGTLEGMGLEGVVCKAKGRRDIIMFKIKRDTWYERLRVFCHGNDKLFESLK